MAKSGSVSAHTGPLINQLLESVMTSPHLTTRKYLQRFKTIEERFREKFAETDGCWEWTGTKASNGYGHFHAPHKRQIGAHRWAWEFANRAEIPPGLVVMHSCNNKGCVNPAHLSVGTQKENIQAAIADGSFPMGEKSNGGGKLKEHQVREIRASSGQLSARQCAKKYGVYYGIIHKIRQRVIWKHVKA
jgi:hypothetical protein